MKPFDHREYVYDAVEEAIRKISKGETDIAAWKWARFVQRSLRHIHVPDQIRGEQIYAVKVGNFAPSFIDENGYCPHSWIGAFYEWKIDTGGRFHLDKKPNMPREFLLGGTGPFPELSVNGSDNGQA